MPNQLGARLTDGEASASAADAPPGGTTPEPSIASSRSGASSSVALLFDLDGTLVDTLPDLHDALSALLVEHGRAPLAPAQTRSFVGRGARDLLRRAWEATGDPAPSERLDALYERFLAIYVRGCTARSRPYPGVIATLTSLRAPLAVVTNKPELPTHAVLAGLGLAGFFGAVVGGDTLPVRKPDPAPLRRALALLGHAGPAVVIGDSATDVEAARRAGLPVVVVAYGYTDRPAEELGADAVVERFDQLPEALARLR